MILSAHKKIAMKTVAGLGICFALVVVAFAHGGDTTKIHSCVDNKTGNIKLVGASATCKAGETALDWNIQGPPGPQGIAGAQGPTGATRATGTTRFTGCSGTARSGWSWSITCGE